MLLHLVKLRFLRLEENAVRYFRLEGVEGILVVPRGLKEGACSLAVVLKTTRGDALQLHDLVG